MSSKKILTIIIICIAIAFSAGMASAESPPSLPVMLYGDVKIDGNPAPVGTTITAKAGTSPAGATSVLTGGTYGEKANDRLPVAASDGASVDFYVNGIKATPSTQFTYDSKNAGTLIRVNLNAISEKSGGSPGGSTNGPSGGSGGGVSGGGIKPTTVPQSAVTPIKSASEVTTKEITKEIPATTNAAPSKTESAFNFYTILGVFAVIGLTGVALKKWGKI